MRSHPELRMGFLSLVGDPQQLRDGTFISPCVILDAPFEWIRSGFQWQLQSHGSENQGYEGVLGPFSTTLSSGIAVFESIF